MAGGASGLYKTEWWGAGVVICLERGADLHMAQLMPLPLTVSCSSKIQIGFTFLVPAHPGSPGQRAVKRVCVLFYDWRWVTLFFAKTIVSNFSMRPKSETCLISKKSTQNDFQHSVGGSYYTALSYDVIHDVFVLFTFAKVAVILLDIFVSDQSFVNYSGFRPSDLPSVL